MRRATLLEAAHQEPCQRSRNGHVTNRCRDEPNDANLVELAEVCVVLDPHDSDGSSQSIT